MAPEANELESQSFVCLFFSLYKLLTFFFSDDIHSSPTKRYKRSTPGSPDFESQPAVVITYVTGFFLQVTNHILEVQRVINLLGAG